MNKPIKYSLWILGVLSVIGLIHLCRKYLFFARFLSDFIYGKPYDFNDLLLVLGWLFCIVCTVLILIQQATVKGTMLKTDSLYQIASVRSDVLVVSSQTVKPIVPIVKIQPPIPPVDAVDPVQPVEETKPRQITSITGEFSSETKNENESEPKLANLNTALRGESFATDEIKEKYKKNLARFAKKKTTN